MYILQFNYNMRYRDFYITESWKDYKVSASPKTILYDFYVLSFLHTLNLEPGLNKSGQQSSATFIGRDSNEIKLDIQNAENVLLPYLKKELSDALFIAICSEIRHAFDNLQDWSKYRGNKLLTQYIRNYQMIQHVPDEFTVKRNVENPPLTAIQHAYVQSYNAATKAITDTGNTKIDFAKLCVDLFTNITWSSSYGGLPWANIAKAYLLLNATPQSKDQLYVAIDHAYDLQHNTGTVLNKLKRYYIQGSVAWLKDALDFKANVKSMYDLLPKCSSDMRKLALEAFKKGGVSKEMLKISTPTHKSIDTLKGSLPLRKAVVSPGLNKNIEEIDTGDPKADVIIKNYVYNGSVGDLSIMDSSLTKLPDNLTVDGDFYLTGCDITHLPKHLTVLSNLFLFDSNIETLPEDLSVEYKVFVSNTPLGKNYTADEIKEMAPGVKGSIYGAKKSPTVDINTIDTGDKKSDELIKKFLTEKKTDVLNLVGANLKQLPDNLTVNGYLMLKYSDILSLPKNLTVTRNLDISNTKIETLPSDLKVKHNLIITGTPMVDKYTRAEIKAMAPGVKGHILGLNKSEEYPAS